MQNQIVLEGITIAYEERGEGRPLVLLHGFGASSYTWRAFVRCLPKGYRSIAPDLKGFGRSQKPRDGKYTAADQATLVATMLERLDLRDVVLIGHSFGGAVAIQTVLNSNVTDRFRALVLVDSMGYPQEMPFFLRALRSPLLGGVILPLLPPAWAVHGSLKRSFYKPNRIAPDLLHAYANNLCTAGGRYALRITAKQIVPSDVDELISRYSNIATPTLIVWGAQDSIIPLSIGQRLARAIPRAKMEVIADCGHAPQEELPARTARIVAEFMSSLPRSAMER